MYKIRTLMVLFLFFLAFKKIQSQTHVLFEIGGSYVTSNLDKKHTRLYDFLALTLNPRVLLIQGKSTSFSLDFPLSIRTKTKDDRNTRSGTILPVLATFNFGAGSGSSANRNLLGFAVGGGWGYFHQLTQSAISEMPQYEETLSSPEPILQAGIRIPHRKRTLFRYNSSTIYPVSVIKFSYLVNLLEARKNIGSLSLLVGLGF